MTFVQRFKHYIVKPLAPSYFSNFKLPFIHENREVKSRDNPLWTALALFYAALLGTCCSTLAPPLLMLWVMPIVTLAAFGLTMGVFEKAKIGAYTVPCYQIKSALMDLGGAAFDALVSGLDTVRKDCGILSEEERREQQQAKDIEEALNTGAELLYRATENVKDMGSWCSTRVISCLSWPKSFLCSDAEEQPASKLSKSQLR